MEIFKLFGSIFVDSSKAQESISKTNDKAESLGSKLGNGIKTAAKWGVALGAAAAGVGAAMMGAANKVAGASDEIDKASRRAGTDAETWQKLNYAMGQSGISSEKLEKSMIKNQQALNDAAEGTEAYAAAYEKLGVSIYDSSGQLKDADDVYQESLKALADMEDINQRNALANQLFGKSYADLAPILDAGSEGIDALTSRAEQLGLVMSQETVDAGVKFGDTLADVKEVGGAIFNMIAAELLPVLQGFLDWIIDSAPQIQETASKVSDFIIKVFTGLKEFWEENGETIKSITSTVWDGIKLAIETALEIIQGIFKVFTGIIEGDWEKFWDGIVQIVKGIGKFLYSAGQAIFTSLWDGLKSVWTSISNWVSEKVSWLVDKLAFWRKSQKEMGGSTSEEKDGSHASGLAYVPYDGYIAELHKGETILNADNSRSMVEDVVNGISTVLSGNVGNTAPITINVQLDRKTIAQAIYEPLQNVAKQKGAVPVG